MSREEGDGKRGGFGIGAVFRHESAEGRDGRDMRAEGEGSKGHHVVADLDVIDFCSNGNDAPGAFDPDGDRSIRETWVKSESFHDIAKIESRSADFDLDLIGIEREAVHATEGKGVEFTSRAFQSVGE